MAIKPQNIMVSVCLSVLTLLSACGQTVSNSDVNRNFSDSAAFIEAESYLAPLIARGRYMEQSCGAEIYDWPEYEGFAVRRCSYSHLGHRGIVYLLNSDAKKIAAWIAHACHVSGSRQLGKCGKALARNAWKGNNTQFAVAGIVIEGEDVLGGQEGVPVSFEFRHGVTVRTAKRLNGSRRQLSDQEMEASARSSLVKVFNWARIAHIHKVTARANGMSVKQTTGIAWAETSRKDYLAALQTGQSELFNALALSMRSAHFP